MKKITPTESLIRFFVKNPDSASDPATRRQYAVLSSAVGIICNIFLFAVKAFSAYLTHSAAVFADAFNNLSDCGSCIVTLLGCRIASKPADKDHPFGHGRIEYLTTLILSVLIITMGVELLRDSVSVAVKGRAAIAQLQFSKSTMILLIIAIVVKLWMYIFNTRIGKRINSSVFIASARDSLNDSVATALTIAALALSKPLDLPLDGIGGIIVSLIILKSGYEILRDTFEEIIGKPADPELTAKIREIVTSNPRIIGVHDLILHSYGPTKAIGSCHAEFRSTESFMDVHDIADSTEREITEKLGISMTIHMDPVLMDDAVSDSLKGLLTEILAAIDKRLSYHDFRISQNQCQTHTHMIFDISAPYELEMNDNELRDTIIAAITEKDGNCTASITIDRE